MTEEPRKFETFEDLRRRAEEIVGQRDKGGDARMSSEEFLRLLHEIEVYQVEVEIQNEELRRTARELRASRDQYQDLFDAAPVGFVVLDGKGRIRRVNAAAAGMFGEDAAWLKGRMLSERIYASDQRAYFSWFREMADRGEMTDGPDLRVLGGGGRYHVRFGAKAIRDAASRLTEWRIALTDITGRKRAEEALRSLNEQLERRVAERTEMASQLRQLAMKLSRVENRERRKIAGILHDDLQQYLAAVKFRIRKCGIADSEKQPLMGLIDESIQRCRSLSYDLSPPVLNQHGFLAALHWLAGEMQTKHGLTVRVENQPEAEPDSQELAFMLFWSVKELLFNAAKHSGADTAAVEATREGDRIRVSVKDDGKGCDPDDIRPKKDELSGFGLFSIRERVEFAGGRFQMESAPGKGCRVTLEVPKTGPAASGAPERAASEAASGGVEPGAPAPGKRIRLLIADDHLVMRQGLSNLLEDEEDLEVVGQAADGEEAVRLAGELNSDVVLMDVTMPEMSGPEATAEIHRQSPHIRIIGLSMHDDPGTAQKMMEAGATAYLYKASPAERLLETIRASISQPEQRDQDHAAQK